MPFIELRSHTAFSFNDGALTPEALAKRAAQLGFHTIGIADTADLGGVPRFVLECQRQGIKPVVGVELNVDGRPAAFYARNAEGMRNIGALVTKARVGSLRGWVKGQNADKRGRPRVAWADVVERSAGIHALTGPASGPIGAKIQACEYSGAARMLGEWKDVFGDRLAVEVQLHHTGGCEAALASANILTALSYDTTIDRALAQGLLHPNGSGGCFRRRCALPVAMRYYILAPPFPGNLCRCRISFASSSRQR